MFTSVGHGEKQVKIWTCKAKLEQACKHKFQTTFQDLRDSYVTEDRTAAKIYGQMRKWSDVICFQNISMILMQRLWVDEEVESYYLVL